MLKIDNEMVFLRGCDRRSRLIILDFDDGKLVNLRSSIVSSKYSATVYIN